MIDSEWPLVGRHTERSVLSQSVRRRRSVVVAGPAGVGKTRLVEHVIAGINPDHVMVHRVIATSASSEIPFGALASVFSLTGAPTTDTIIDMGQARTNLIRAAGDRQLLVWVDNANLLDEPSSETLGQMAVAGEAQLVVTVRNEEPVLPSTTMLWKERIADRIELEPLAEADARDLIERVLDGAVDRISCSAILQLARGNPMFLRELLLAAHDAGTLVWMDNIWSLRGPLDMSNRLTEVVEARLSRMSAPERAMLELVAIGEPLEFDLLLRVGDESALGELERHGLIEIDHRKHRTVVTTAHPIYAEVVRSAIPLNLTRTLRVRLADEVVAMGAKRDTDIIRVATWKVQAGCAIDPELGSEAARQALVGGDLALARRLALASDPEHSFNAASALGGVFFLDGKGEEADRWLRLAYDLAANEAEKREAAVARGFNLFLTLQRWDEALSFIAAVEEDLTDPIWKSEARAARAVMLRLRGETPEALVLAKSVLGDVAATDVAVGRALTIAHLCAVANGEYARAAEYAERSASLAGRLSELRLDEMVLAAMHTLAVGFESDLGEGTSLARQGYEAAVAAHSYADIAFWGAALSELLILGGAIAEARRVLEETAAVVRITDPLAMAVPVFSAAALVAVLSGDARDAKRLIVEATSSDADAAGRAQSALSAYEGDRLRAAQIALRSAERSFDRGDITWGLLSLHDATRFGHPDIAIAYMRKLVPGVEGDLFSRLLEHTEALQAQDVDELEAVANHFEKFGALMLAAEALSQASLVAATSPQRARRLEARAVALFQRCEGAAPPRILVDVRSKILTSRETEIAQLAAAGESSREIAESLFISVRTVDNHLASVYGKLAVSGRRELAAVFGVDRVAI